MTHTSDPPPAPETHDAARAPLAAVPRTEGEELAEARAELLALRAELRDVRAELADRDTELALRREDSILLEAFRDMQEVQSSVIQRMWWERESRRRKRIEALEKAAMKRQERAARIAGGPLRATPRPPEARRKSAG